MINIKRVYEPGEKKDGFRILVDRLWPRGLKKDAANIDKWEKEIAPSPSLRKKFHQAPEKWQEFKAEYLAELKHNNSLHGLIHDIKENKVVTLLYASRDEQHNHAIILKDFLEHQAK